MVLLNTTKDGPKSSDLLTPDIHKNSVPKGNPGSFSKTTRLPNQEDSISIGSGMSVSSRASSYFKSAIDAIMLAKKTPAEEAHVNLATTQHRSWKANEYVKILECVSLCVPENNKIKFWVDGAQELNVKVVQEFDKVQHETGRIERNVKQDEKNVPLSNPKNVKVWKNNIRNSIKNITGELDKEIKNTNDPKEKNRLESVLKITKEWICNVHNINDKNKDTQTSKTRKEKCAELKKQLEDFFKLP